MEHPGRSTAAVAWPQAGAHGALNSWPRADARAGRTQDLFRILTEPETNMIAQQQLLMATEGIDLQFTDAAIDAIAGTAAEVNKTLHNIGARRLHTVRPTL